MDNFKCGLCKNWKAINEKKKLILFSPADDTILQGNICNLCFVKIHHVFKGHSISEINKQQMLDQWGIEFPKEEKIAPPN